VQLEQLRAELGESQAERQAQRDYRYDAVKRLYTDLQPLLFQLSELCESAYTHTRGLARASRDGKLGTGSESWWLGDDYYLISTVWRLLVPLAVLQLMQRRLTRVDLSVDEELNEQYRFARALAGTWNSGFDIAGKEPTLRYRPHDSDARTLVSQNPEVYDLQHLYAGQISKIVGCLVGRDSEDQLHYRTFGEFESEYRTGPTRELVAPAVQLFSGFHPRTHPVLWRMLVIQSHLHCAIACTFAEDAGVIVPPTRALSADEQSKFDWREPGAPETEKEALEAPFRAARAYLDEALGVRAATRTRTSPA
jgi:hypothetical protein